MFKMPYIGLMPRKWPFGLDGGLLITAGSTVTLPAGIIKDYSSIQIDAGGTLVIDGSTSSVPAIIGSSGPIVVNGTIRTNTIDSFISFLSSAADNNKINSSADQVAVQSDGKILVSGNFTNYAGTANRNYLIRLNSDGTLDTVFCTNAVDGAKFSGTIYLTTIQSDGKILVGGNISNYAGTANRNSLIRLNSDGTLDTAFCTNAVDGAKFVGAPSVTAVQSDGKILVGGSFVGYAGTAGRSYLIRLNSDGTLDTTFCTNAVDGSKFNSGVFSIAVQSDGKILVSGNFTNYAGTANRNRLIRLNSDGTLDTTFCTNAVDGAKINQAIYAINPQSDGKILIGGAFTSYAGTANRSYLIRLNSDGTLDTTFCTNAVDGAKFNNFIYSSFVQSDNKILIGGSFTNYAGTAGRGYLIRLNSDGTLDTAFCTNAVDSSKFNQTVYSIDIQSDGKILASGAFTNYAGTTNRNRLIRLNSDGTLNTEMSNTNPLGDIISYTIAQNLGGNGGNGGGSFGGGGGAGGAGGANGSGGGGGGGAGYGGNGGAGGTNGSSGSNTGAASGGVGNSTLGNGGNGLGGDSPGHGGAGGGSGGGGGGQDDGVGLVENGGGGGGGGYRGKHAVALEIYCKSSITGTGTINCGGAVGFNGGNGGGSSSAGGAPGGKGGGGAGGSGGTLKIRCVGSLTVSYSVAGGTGGTAGVSGAGSPTNGQAGNNGTAIITVL